VKKNVRTIKLKMYVAGEQEKTDRIRLKKIANETWRAANIIINGQFLNDEFLHRIRCRLKIEYSDPESRNKVEDEFKEFFGVKRAATTERDIKSIFPNLPSCVTNTLNQIVTSSYSKDKKDILAGIRSVRTYKKGMPIPMTKKSTRLSIEDDKYYFSWTLSRADFIRFKIILGSDKINNRSVLDKIISKRLDYGIPQIQIKNNKTYLLLPIKEPVKSANLNRGLSVGVDMGLAVPAYAGLSKGQSRKSIGSFDDFLRVRLQLQKRRTNLQSRLVSARGGKGRKKKLKALMALKEKESNFVKSYNHFISREIVRFALKNNAGVIKMEMLEGFGCRNKKDFVLRNWSYFKLQEFITYKAERVGIKVVKVDPYHTSQTCSECGHYEKNQRISQPVFICKKCGAKLNADYNAAVNIAKSDKVVEKKEQCQFYIQQKRQSGFDTPSLNLAKAG